MKARASKNFMKKVVRPPSSILSSSERKAANNKLIIIRILRPQRVQIQPPRRQELLSGNHLKI